MSKTRLDYYQHGACQEKWIQRFDEHFSITYHGMSNGAKGIIDKVLVMASDNVKTDSDGTYSRFNSETVDWVRENWKRGGWGIYHYNGNHFNVVNDIKGSDLYLDTNYNISMDEFVKKHAIAPKKETAYINAKYFANWLRKQDCYIDFITNMDNDGDYSTLTDLIDDDDNSNGDREAIVSMAFDWGSSPEKHDFWEDIDENWREHLEKPKKKKVVKAATKRNPETDIFEF